MELWRKVEWCSCSQKSLLTQDWRNTATGLRILLCWRNRHQIFVNSSAFHKPQIFQRSRQRLRESKNTDSDQICFRCGHHLQRIYRHLWRTFLICDLTRNVLSTSLSKTVLWLSIDSIRKTKMGRVCLARKCSLYALYSDSHLGAIHLPAWRL